MASHDIVAQRDYLPKLQDITFDDFDDEEETVKMVQLVKTQDPTVSELLYYRQRRVRGFVLLSSRFPFVYVSTYANGNLDANETKPRTRRCRSYCTCNQILNKIDCYLQPLLGFWHPSDAVTISNGFKHTIFSR